MNRARSFRVALAAIAIAVLAGACTTEPLPDADSAVVDTAPEPPPTPEPLDDPLAEMRRVDDQDRRLERTYRLLVVNSGLESVVVRAEAGADEVSIDSIMPGDSVRVELAVRSDSVSLIAGRRPGTVELRHVLRYPADSTRRLEIVLP